MFKETTCIDHLLKLHNKKSKYVFLTQLLLTYQKASLLLAVSYAFS